MGPNFGGGGVPPPGGGYLPGGVFLGKLRANGPLYPPPWRGGGGKCLFSDEWGLV